MAPPNATKPSVGGAFGGGGGRKLRIKNLMENKRPVSNGTASESGDEDNMGDTKKRKKRAPKTMEELDRRIEEDELELMNMKREIKEQQKVEINKAQKRLIRGKEAI